MALTEKYVSESGSGAGDGSTALDAMSWATMVSTIASAGAGGSAGIRYNVVGSISRTTTNDTISGGGTSTSPLVIRGYASTIGDAYLGRASDGALITTNMPAISYTTAGLAVSATFTIIEGLNLSFARNGAGVSISGADSRILRCVVDNAAPGGSGVCISVSATRNTVFDCDATLSNGGNAGSAAILQTGTGSKVKGCRITSSAVGLSFGGAAMATLHNTIYGCAGVGLAVTATGAYGFIEGNTIVGGSGDGIDVVSGLTTTLDIWNNLLTDNGGYGIDLNNANVGCFLSNNRYRDNSSGPIHLGTDWVSATDYASVTSGSGSTDYVDAGSDDYRLIAASPATSAGVPASASMGALQRDQTGSGSSGTPAFVSIG